MNTYTENHYGDYRATEQSNSLRACGATIGGGSEVLVVASYGFKPRNSSSARSIGFAEELAPTLAADGSSCEGGC